MRREPKSRALPPRCTMCGIRVVPSQYMRSTPLFRERFKNTVRAALIACLLLLSSPVVDAAIQIVYEAHDVQDQVAGQDLWRYDYLVSGYAFDPDQSFFTILFPIDLYEDVQAGVSPPGWIAETFPADAIFQATIFQAFGDSDETSQLLFSASFGWFDPSAPGAQLYRLYNYDSVNDEYRYTEGRTTLATVPEPETLWLLFTSLVMLAFSSIRGRFQRASPCTD